MKKCFFCQRFVEYEKDPNVDVYNGECDTCGNFQLAGTLYRTGSFAPDDIAWKMSAWVTEQNEKGITPEIYSTYKTQIAAKIETKNIEQKFNHALLVFAKKSEFGGFHISFSPSKSYPLFWAQNEWEFQFIVNELHRDGYLVLSLEEDSSVRDSEGIDFFKMYEAGFDYFYVSLTGKGWERVNELKHGASESNSVFVAMSFAPSMTKVYEEGFRTAIESEGVGYDALRLDKTEFLGNVDDRIIMEIRRSKFIVADFTGQRGGVYFEAGFAQGIGKHVIYCCDEKEKKDLHFDIRQFNFILWENIEDLKERVTNRIKALNL